LATWLVVGLGNPGPTYSHNRHNAGVMVAHELARRGSATWKAKRLQKAEAAEVRVTPAGIGVPSADAQRAVLATTRTYMNQSGVPVKNLLTELKLRPDHLIVVHDELDLDLGQIRAKFGGGDNGHNGLKSIRAMLGSGDYFRVRVGIGRPTTHIDVIDWVLTNFTSAERDQLLDVVTRAADAVESLITQGLEPTQSRYNS